MLIDYSTMSSKKKQSSIALILSDAVDVKRCLSFCDDVDWKYAGDNPVNAFILELSTLSRLQDQMKASQRCRGSIKSYLRSFSLESNQSLSILIYLYYFPDTLPLRKSLDWIVEELYRECRLQSEVDSNLREESRLNSNFSVIINAFNSLINHYSRMIDSRSMSVADFMSWSISFNMMSLLDRDIPWFITSEQELHTKFGITQSSSILLQFLTAIDHILMNMQCYVSPSASLESMHSIVGSTDILRYVECTAEALRAALNAIKALLLITHSSSFTAIEIRTNNQFQAIIDRCMLISGCIMSSSSLHKDIITAGALIIAHIQWILLIWRFGANSSQVRCTMNYLLSKLIVSDTLTACSNQSTQENEVANMSLHAITSHLLSRMSPLNKAVLLRAFLTVCDDYSLYLVEDSCNQISNCNHIFYDHVLAAALSLCQHSIPEIRISGLQLLESWLNRLESINFTLEPSVFVSVWVLPPDLLVNKLLEIMRALVSSFTHPVKLVSHIAPTVYERVLKLIQKVRNQLMSTSDPGFWQTIVQGVMNQHSPRHRSRYQALHILLQTIGVADFLSACRTDTIDELVRALETRDIASSVATLVLSLIKTSTGFSEVNPQSGRTTYSALCLEKSRQLWTRSVALALCDSNRKLRQHVVDYLLGELVKFDGESVIPLLREVRSFTWIDFSLKLWATVSIYLQARLQGVFTSPIISAVKTASNIQYISEDELKAACISTDDGLRMNALLLLVAAQKPSTPLIFDEIQILMLSFRYSVKSCQSLDQQQRLLRVVKLLLVRLVESTNLKSRNKQNNVNSGLTNGLEVEQWKIEPESLTETVMQWLHREITNNLYPGASYERELLGLQMLRLTLDTISNSKDSKSINPIFLSFLQLFKTNSIVQSLFNCVLSSWDRARHLACELLVAYSRLPSVGTATESDGLPGFDTFAKVCDLLGSAFALVVSPRLRESDAGAFLLQTLMNIYCVKLQWDFSSLLPRAMSSNIDDPYSNAPVSIRQSLVFVHFLMLRIRSGVEPLQALFNQFNTSNNSATAILFPPLITQAVNDHNANNDRSKSDELSHLSAAEAPLCHGLLQSVRLCLTALSVDSGFLKFSPNEVARTTATGNELLGFSFFDLYALTKQCLSVAMTVVAEATSDEMFSPHLIISDHVIGSLGPVNANTLLQTPTARYVNTNSVLGLSVFDNEESDFASTATLVQRAVVAAWYVLVVILCVVPSLCYSFVLSLMKLYSCVLTLELLQILSI